MGCFQKVVQYLHVSFPLGLEARDPVRSSRRGVKKCGWGKGVEISNQEHDRIDAQACGRSRKNHHGIRSPTLLCCLYQRQGRDRYRSIRWRLDAFLGLGSDARDEVRWCARVFLFLATGFLAMAGRRIWMRSMVHRLGRPGGAVERRTEHHALHLPGQGNSDEGGDERSRVRPRHAIHTHYTMVALCDGPCVGSSPKPTLRKSGVP